MKTLFSFILCVFVFAYSKGQIAGTVYDHKENAISGASVLLVENSKILDETSSDKNGYFSFDIDNNSQNEINILMTHTGFRNLKTKPTEQEKYFLTPEEKTEESITETKKYKKNTVARLLGFWVKPGIGINFDSELATLIPSDLKKKKIKSLKYQLSSLVGRQVAKNSKYQPFNACIYTVNTLTGKPDKCIYSSGKVAMEKNQKWFRVNIDSLNITMPDEGLFIVFQILPRENYQTPFIVGDSLSSTIPYDVIKDGGFGIPYIPHLKSKIYDPNKPRKSYESSIVKSTGHKTWKLSEKYGFCMDFEFEN